MAFIVEVETAPESNVWNNYTSITDATSLQVVSQGGADAGTATCLLRDIAGTAVVLPESGFRVTDGSTVIFRGKIKRRGKTEKMTNPRGKWYSITAQDITCLLLDDIIDTGGNRTTAESDKARIEWILTTFGTKGITGGSAVQTIYGSNLPEQDFTGQSLYEAINDVTKFGGGQIYVDTSKVLHHFLTENNPAPFNLSDSPNGSTTFGYRDFDFPDDSIDLVNAVFVIGEADVGEWVTNATSISTYGRREAAFRDATLADSTARQAAGNAILTKYKDPRGPIGITVFRPGLRAGMTIQITNSVWSLTAVTYRIEQVDASILGTTGTFQYRVTLQDAPVTLQNYLHETLTTINRDVKRGTNAAVDYAAQFLVGRVKVVAALPPLPDPNYPIGMQVFLTADEKLYRNPDDVAWTASIPASDITGQITSTQISDEAISTPKLAAGSVTAEAIAAGAVGADQIAANSIIAGHIAAGAIGAEALAAEIVLADTLLTTGLSGRRIEIDDEGMRAYSAAEQLLVNIPTVGTDPVSVVGAVEASTLVSTTTAELRGATSLVGGSVMTAQVGVTTPTTPPVVTASLSELTLGTVPAQKGHGIVYDSAGGAGGATPSYWVGADPTVGNLLDVAYEYDASTGALLRTIRKTGSDSTATTTLGSTSHVGDTWEATSGASLSQIATPLTMPRDGTITKVSVYVSGYGGDCACRNAVWSSGNTLLRSTATYTANSKSPSAGGAVKHDVALSSPLAVTAGQVLRVGFLRNSSGDGFWWDRDGGSSKTTYKGDGLNGNLTSVSTDGSNKPNVYITYEYTVSSSLEGTMGKIIGVARQGTYIWVLDANGVLFRYNQATLAYVDQFNLSANIAGTKANAGLFWDGTNLIITTATGVTGTDQVRFVKVSTAGAFVSNNAATGLTINGSTATVRGGYDDGTSIWVSINGVVYAFSRTTFANTANRDFGTSPEAVSGVTRPPSGFASWSSTNNPGKVFLYTSWDWTTESPIYYVCYAWYDSNATGGTHETAVSPRATITLGRRRKLQVSNPAIPVGGTDDPDKVRVYLERGASDPGGTGYKRQSEDALTTRTWTSFNTGGAANSGTNTFPAGTAAVIKSLTPGWELRGDGTTILGSSTSFPGSPATGQTVFRSDIGLWFYWDGTRWLSTEKFVSSGVNSRTTWPISASSSGNFWAPLQLHGGTDLWLISVDTFFQVTTGGTALGASHKWTISPAVFPAAAGFGTVSIDSGTSGTNRGLAASVNALLSSLGTAASQVGWYTSIAKTGTPGDLYIGTSLNYRVVAT